MEKERKAKCIPKNVMGVFTDLHEDKDENTPCGFCGLKYSSVQSVQKRDWIRCHKYKTWYHEVCVGAVDRKQFKCAKCSLNLSEKNSHTDEPNSLAIFEIPTYCIRPTWHILYF